MADTTMDQAIEMMIQRLVDCFDPDQAVLIRTGNHVRGTIGVVRVGVL